MVGKNGGTILQPRGEPSVDRVLKGQHVVVRSARTADLPLVAAVRRTPEVFAYRRDDGFDAYFVEHGSLPNGFSFYVIESALGEVVGGVSVAEQNVSGCLHAALSVFLSPSVHGLGWGADSLRAVIDDLILRQGHHRFTADPGLDNLKGIACFERIGFRSVGIMRKYEKRPDGTLGDGLFMELLADDFVWSELR